MGYALMVLSFQRYFVQRHQYLRRMEVCNGILRTTPSFVRSKEYYHATSYLENQENWKAIYQKRKAMIAVLAESSKESEVVVKRGM